MCQYLWKQQVTKLTHLPFLRRDKERRSLRAHYPRHPQWTAKAPRPRRGTSQRLPPLIHRKRKIGIDEDVAVAVVSAGPLHAHHLVPAVHAADRIRMDRECNVLVHARIAPPNSFCIGIGGVVGFHSRDLAHFPLSLADFLQIDPRARHAFDLILLVDAPASEMV